MYFITDEFGAHYFAFTKTAALRDLSRCAGHAWVTNVWGRVVAERGQNA
jgi:hypothetical protein